MFSIATVASSTRMPTASARPPSVIKLMFCPLTHSANVPASSAMGMLMTTMNALRQSRRNSSTIRPVSTAPPFFLRCTQQHHSRSARSASASSTPHAASAADRYRSRATFRAVVGIVGLQILM